MSSTVSGAASRSVTDRRNDEDRGSASAGQIDPADPSDAPPVCDRAASELDDRADREELRTRYYGLLQELRVLLPGVQVMVAFLLTVPFANRFEDLDTLGLRLFAVALCSGMLAVVSFIGPTAYHRLGNRTARSQRLQWSIRMTVAGIGFLAVSLLSALAVVTRFLFGDATAAAMTGSVFVVMLVMWVLIPRQRGQYDES
jgi:cation transport ATPase